MKRILSIALVTTVATVFTAVAITNVRDTTHKLQFTEVQLQNRSNELKVELEESKRLETRLNDGTEKSQQEIEQLRKEVEERKRNEQRLEQELQAKLQKKEQERIANENRQKAVVNAITGTQTVSAVAPTPAPQPTNPSSVEGIVRQAAINNGLDPDWFVRLAMCESTLNPNAVNASYYENGHPSGLFQHLSGYWPARASQHGYAGASVFDPVANANVTAKMWKSGSHLWECQ